MRRRSTSFLVAVLVALTIGAPTAAAQTEPDGAAPPVAATVHPMVFPVVGDVVLQDTYGAPRSGGRYHQGQDLMGRKMQELVAAAAGRITYLTSIGSLSGAMVQLTGDDGWVYSYLHLNNDTPGTDDGKADPADTFGPGIVKGARVVAGQLLGYLGDSGNAEGTAPHLHFELERPDGTTVNPYESLRAATRPAGAIGSTPSPIRRLAGADRVATSIAVSNEGWPTGSPEVVVAAGDSYAEALPASVLAAARRGPLLLSTGTALSAPLAAELQRLRATRVAVVGSVPASVADAIAAGGRTVERLGTADDPTTTAVAVARAVGGAAGTAVLVNGDRFADGVSATAIAAGRGWPVLLTDTSTVPQRTVDAWRALGIRQLVIVGGTSVVATNVESFARSSGRCMGAVGCPVERLAGTDRYGTSVAVVQRSVALGGRTAGTVLLGTGTSYADVLTSGPLASQLGGIALLVDGSGGGADRASLDFLASSADSVQRVSILGGTGAVSAAADRTLQATLGLD